MDLSRPQLVRLSDPDMTGEVDRFYRGEQVNALRPKLNKLADATNLLLSPNSGTSVAGVPDFSRVAILEIVDASTVGVLVCMHPGMFGTANAEQYDVYSPPSFSWVEHDGITYAYTDVNTRTASDGGTPETQYLTPALLVGDLLMCEAVMYPSGLTSTWRWSDRNVDGRQWAADTA